MMKSIVRLAVLAAAVWARPVQAVVVDFDGARLRFSGTAKASLSSGVIWIETAATWENIGKKPIDVQGDLSGEPFLIRAVYVENGRPDAVVPMSTGQIAESGGVRAVQSLTLQPGQKAQVNYSSRLDSALGFPGRGHSLRIAMPAKVGVSPAGFLNQKAFRLPVRLPQKTVSQTIRLR